MDNDGYFIYESKINKNIKEDFDIIESIATFHNKSFIERIKDEIKFYEMSIESLSKSCNIGSFRLNALINGNAKFEAYEIDLIKKRLHI